MAERIRENQCKAALMGLIVGDALGVPVEFVDREELRENPVKDMRRYGTHNQPAGTWSDDSSMVIATMEWIAETKKMSPDYPLLMEKGAYRDCHGFGSTNMERYGGYYTSISIIHHCIHKRCSGCIFHLFVGKYFALAESLTNGLVKGINIVVYI